MIGNNNSYEGGDENEKMGEVRLDEEDNKTTLFKERSVWDEKELEKRTEIANKFWKVGLIEAVDELIDLVKTSEKKYIALEMRIAFKENEYFLFDSILRDINKHIASSQSLLDSYVIFSNSTPKFENMQTSLHGFHKFISDEEERPFHQIHVKNENIYYFRFGKLNKHVKEISFLLSRLIGTLKTAGNYIIDTENESQSGGSNRFDNDRFGKGMDNISGYDRYMGGMSGYDRNNNNNGNYPFDKFGNVNITKINSPKKRDFGDGKDD